MIDKIHVLNVIQTELEGTDKFLVDLKITTDNRIYVSIDGDNGIVIDDCIALSRAIENSLDREAEDFELNVASAGVDTPLKLQRQYRKNVSRDLSVETTGGEHLEGGLEEADETGIVLRPFGRKQAKAEPRKLEYSEIRTAKVMVRF